MKNISKSITAVLICTVLAGCSGNSADIGKTYNVGIIQLMQHVALDQATQGFKDALVEEFGESVIIEEQNASGETATCATIANQYVTEGVDLIMCNATAPLQAAAAATNEIPILGTSVTDYATALDIDDFDGTVGGNISGTSDLAPLDEQAALFKELLPDVKTIGLLYCSGEPNSKYQADVIRVYLEDEGYTVVDYTFADSNDIQSVTTAACANCDALYIPTDNTAANSTELINNVALPAGVPIIAGEEGICSGCGIATLSINYYDLGYATGLQAVKVLKGETKISEMAIEYAPNVTKEYDASRCEALNITIPDGYTAIE